MSKIVIKDAMKKYGDVTVIEDLSLTIQDGEFFTLLGPSGCGKTTLLRMIAGFNSIEGGDFYFDDIRINDMDPSKRNIGMVFQNYAIFPHMTVRQNVEFGLNNRKLPKQTVHDEANKFLKMMQIDDYAQRLPENLSGGQQQRIALARALVIKPEVLLMDEPLSNLDAKLRLEMRQVIRNIQREVGITTVYVTHDQEEAMSISDRIAIVKLGQIQQVGRPQMIYQRPANIFVATFIGRSNILDAHIADGVLSFVGGYSDKNEAWQNIAEQDVKVSVRPEEFVISEDNSGDGIKAKVIDSVYLGMDTHFYVTTDNENEFELIRESDIDDQLGKGVNITLTLKLNKINIFTFDGTKNLLRSE